MIARPRAEVNRDVRDAMNVGWASSATSMYALRNQIGIAPINALPGVDEDPRQGAGDAGHHAVVDEIFESLPKRIALLEAAEVGEQRQ